MGSKEEYISLTKLQRAFVREYCADPKMGQAEAAAKAGYSRARAKITACELMKHPEIQAEIERLLSGQVDKAALSPETVIADLEDIDNACKTVGASNWALSLRLKISELRAKVLHMFDEAKLDVIWDQRGGGAGIAALRRRNSGENNSITVRFVEARDGKELLIDSGEWIKEKEPKTIEALPPAPTVATNFQARTPVEQTAPREEAPPILIPRPKFQAVEVNADSPPTEVHCDKHGPYKAVPVPAPRLRGSPSIYAWSFCPACQDEARANENWLGSLLPADSK